MSDRRGSKRRMRRQIVPDLHAPDLRRLSRVMRRRRMREIGRIAAILVILLLVFTVFSRIIGSLRYKSYSVVWENTDLASSDASYEEFNDDILKVTLDGVSALDYAGNVLWNYGYSMRTPRTAICGEYGAVADIQSTSAVIFNSDGEASSVTTTLPILNLTVSSHGVLALVVDDSGADYVTFYDNTGAALDIKIKTKLSGEGYPLDIGISPTGTGLISSVVYMDQNTLQNQVVFYNFDVGQSDSNRMVGYYNYGETMFPEVVYLSDTKAVAFGDNQVNIYSLKNESKPNVIKSIEVDEEICSVFHDSDQIGIICQTESASRELRVYSSEGSLKYKKDIDFDYDTAEFSNGYAVLYNSGQCMVINSRGKTRYSGTLDAAIQNVVVTGSRTCLVMSAQSVRKIRFK